MQHEIEVMNHEVKDHSDIGPSRLKGGESQALDIAGTIQVGLCRTERPVVALDMTDLELEPLPVGGSNEVVGFRQRRRERLFHQHWNSPLQCAEADLAMAGRWYRNRYGL